MKSPKVYTKKQNFPIYAGMEFAYPKTKNDKLKKVGFYTVEFIYDTKEMDCLIDQRKIKTKFY